MLTKTIDLFVNFVDASNPIPVENIDASAQTFDGNIMMIFGLMLLLLASLCFIFVFRKHSSLVQ